MKQIDWSSVGLGVLIACWGASYVVESYTNRDVARICAERGGNMVTVDGAGWTKDKVCQFPKVKP